MVLRQEGVKNQGKARFSYTLQRSPEKGWRTHTTDCPRAFLLTRGAALQVLFMQRNHSQVITYRRCSGRVALRNAPQPFQPG